MEVCEDIGGSTITQNKIMLWWTAIITVLFLPHTEKLWQHDSIPRGCREFASSKIILHLQLLKMDGFESPLPYFPRPTLQSTELNNSELETSSSTQKNVSSLSLTWSWSCLYFFDC